MMKLIRKKLQQYCLFALLLLLGVSCQSDYLSESNPNAKPVEDYFTSLVEADKVLTAAYSSLLNHYNLNILEEAWRSDLGYPSVAAGRPRVSGQGEPWYYKTYTNSQNEINKKWAALYTGIFRCNQLIEGLEGPLAAESENPIWVSQMAQVRMLRGIFHFYLYQTYNNGRVIIRNSVPIELEDFNIPVSSKEEVRAFILEDLEYGYENLPIFYGSESENELSSGRMTKGIATMFLGNLYLLEAPANIDGDEINPDYEKAKLYYEELISGAYPYALETDESAMFTRKGEFNTESIFEIIYDDNMRPELDRWDEQSPSNRLARYSAPGSQGGQRAFTPTAWIAYAYKTEVKDTKDPRNFYLEEQEDGSFLTVERNVSLRASASVALVNDEQTQYYRSGITPEVVSFGKYEFSYWKKFSNHDIVTSENNLPKGAYYSGKNVVVNRLSEAYLNLAECYLATGNETKAMSLINEVRKKWGLQLIGLSQGNTANDYDGKIYSNEDLWNHLMFVEKPLELGVEGHAIRWIDLRRWGKIQENFERVANQTFRAETYFFTNSEGKTQRRNRSDLFPYNQGDETFSIPIIDCEDAVLNYNPTLHDYYPLPLEEIISNPNLGK
ncbi:RagB/SusD family nutrient uptake outer membrane protein [Flammeovirga kamogawensis]|uniref:RagB/SusD family nutrient uptake outer membrane protein n=1 Tax=Flammeovirga kamogawensis TaxID=373891 RepID=A0ABX8H5F2_9BACT|nr:RagB/SusD family nutrient uptake outer membrane protein [Flammeovirga kamogawensis]MBB6463524.1 hypothetical protein [Flammeovirga kamogawensis]QWG10582.1 RagB/SusD family nutrient uptake outer membrane protein [Flammeovirga kamogawensis]TRX63688.1 RagB/SusD family nutrient uptake outer membrane protein [Flammeovirga kamogawensis]